MFKERAVRRADFAQRLSTNVGGATQRGQSGAAGCWELSQTTIRAPADGYVPVVALTVGDRALQASSAMSFIVENKITIVGMLSQKMAWTIKIGASPQD